MVPNKICGQGGGKEKRSSAESVKEGFLGEVNLKQGLELKRLA